MSTALLKGGFPAQELDPIVKRLLYLLNSACGAAGIQAGTTAGKLKTVNAIDLRVDGQIYHKAATDDLWDLSAEVTLPASTYRAYWLLLNTSGTASFVHGANSASAAAALADLVANQVPDATKSIIGCYVSSAAQNFANALTGTFYDGIPVAAACLDSLTSHGP